MLYIYMYNLLSVEIRLLCHEIQDKLLVNDDRQPNRVGVTEKIPQSCPIDLFDQVTSKALILLTYFSMRWQQINVSMRKERGLHWHITIFTFKN